MITAILLVFGLSLINSAEHQDFIPQNKINRSYNYTTLNDIDKKITYIDSVLSSDKNNTNPEKQALLLKDKADLYRENGLFSTAITVYNKAFETIEILQNTGSVKILKMDILFDRGKTNIYKGLYDNSISDMYEFLKINNEEFESYTIKANLMLGTLFLYINKADITKKYLDESLKLLEISNPKDSSVISNKYELYNTFAHFYSQKKDFDSALIYLKYAQRYCNGDKRKLNATLQNTAIVYNDMGEPELAKEYLNKILTLNPKEYDKLIILNNLGSIYYTQGLYDNALTLYNDALKIAKNTDAKFIKGNIMLLIADIYSKRGDYKNAYFYKDSGQAIIDSTFNSENEEKMILLNSDFESYKIENDKKLLEFEIEVAQLSNFKKNIIIILLAVSFIFAIVASFIITKRLTKQNKVNKILKRTIDSFDETKEEIIKSSKHEFETEINQKTRELTSNAMFMAKNVEITRNIADKIIELKKINNSLSADKIFSEIFGLLKDLNTNNKSWDDFKIYFEQVHPSFFANLSANTNLTTGEKRMCAFLVMNLTTKEIAALTNRSKRTVETVKFHIRQKLNIPSNVQTIDFLMQFVD